MDIVAVDNDAVVVIGVIVIVERVVPIVDNVTVLVCVVLGVVVVTGIQKRIILLRSMPSFLPAGLSANSTPYRLHPSPVQK